MLTLSRTYLRWEVDLPESRWAPLADRAWTLTEDSREGVSVERTGTSCEVVVGSTAVVMEVVANAVDVMEAISLIGGFWGAVALLRSQGHEVGTRIRNRFRRQSPLPPSSLVSTRVSTGQLGSLERLHRQVGEGTLDRNTAVVKAIKLMGRAGEELSPDLVASLEDAFRADHEGIARVYEYRAARTTDALSVRESGAALHSPRLPASRRRRGVRIKRDPGSTLVVREDL